MAEASPSRPVSLFVRLGPKTAQRLDDLISELEVTKTDLISRLIHEEHLRVAATIPPVVKVPPTFEPHIGDDAREFFEDRP